MIRCFSLLFFFPVAKTQWNASIDFKWIRDNKDAVADNIRNRNSNADLELVLELYAKMLEIQKVRFRFETLALFSPSIAGRAFGALSKR